MRIYLDSNIFRKTKQTSNQFNKEVFDVMEKLKDVFIFQFSEGHLHDLSKSEESYREEDLKHMEQYVANNYICRDHIKKDIHFYLKTPTEAYQTIDFSQMDFSYENPLSFLDDLDDLEGGSEMKEMFQKLFDMPIFDPIEVDTSALAPDVKALAQQFQDIRSMNDMLKKMQGISPMLDSPKEFKKYQDILRPYIDRKEYSFDEWSFDFDERMKDTLFGKSFSEMVELTLVGADKEDEYQRFINTYTHLEAFGVTQETTGSKQKLKKNSFWDIHKDAVHAFFASKSDYYVTDDLGAQTKAFIVFKLLDIPTEVLSVKDYLSKCTFLLKNEEDIYSLAKGLVYSLERGFVINQSVLEDRQLIKLNYPVMNYFNRMQINNKERSVNLFRSSKLKTGILFAEVNLLIKKCTKLFGQDIDFKDESALGEYGKFEDGETIRKWNYGNSMVTLTWEKNSFGEHIITLSLHF